MKIYADHAATTKLDIAAFEAMKPYLMEEFGNASQLYSFSRAPKKALKEARESIAECIGAAPEEIFFTSGGTESDNWAIKGSAFLGAEHRATITSAFEHHAVLHSCEAIERLGFPVVYLKPNSSGIITPDRLREIITDRTLLVSIMYANNEIGTIQPIKELAEIAHLHGAIFHTDAVQAVGHVALNVHELGVDMLSASAHKFNGPKGVGFLYIKRGTKISPFADGGAQEGKLRAGTENVAGIVGMAEALKISYTKLDERKAHLEHLEKILIESLTRDGFDFRMNGGTQHVPGNISLSFRNADGETLLHRLDLMGICVSTGSACNSESTELSHVLKAIDLPLDYAYGTIRISLGYENTTEEVIAIVDSLRKILAHCAVGET